MLLTCRHTLYDKSSWIILDILEALYQFDLITADSPLVKNIPSGRKQSVPVLQKFLLLLFRHVTLVGYFPQLQHLSHRNTQVY